MKFGLPPSEYWEMSFDEITLFLESKVEHLEESNKNQLSQSLVSAFYNAYWTRVEKLSGKDLTDALSRFEERKHLTGKEMENKLKQFVIMFGGKVEGGD